MKRFICFVFLLAPNWAVAQAPIPDYSPSALAKSINNLESHLEALYSCRSKPCTTEEKTALKDYESKINQIAKELEIPEGKLAGCSKVTQVNIRLDGIHKDAFLRIQRGWDLNLVVLTRRSGNWKFLRNLIVPNKYEDVVVSVQAVTDDSSEQILVHKAQFQAGTGLNQQNFLIYKLIHEKLTVILNVVERGWLTSPWTKNEVSQESKFEFEKATTAADPVFDTAPSYIETQIVKLSGLKIELKREHSWDEDQNQFVASQWYSGRKVPKTVSKPKVGGNNPTS